MNTKQILGACALLLAGVAQAKGLQSPFTREAAPQIFARAAKMASPFASLLSDRPLVPVREAGLKVAISKVFYRADAQGHVGRFQEDVCGGGFNINVYDLRQSTDTGAKFRGGECAANFKKTGASHVFIAAVEAIRPGSQFGDGHSDMKEVLGVVGFSDFENIYTTASAAINANSAEGYLDFDFNLFDSTVGPVDGDEAVRVQMLLNDNVLGR